MQHTTNYIFNKPEGFDKINIGDINENMDIIDVELKKKLETKDIPSSLPANGGNADTVDNKHASDFASATHSHNKSDIGLGNVDNTADANKSVNYASTAGTANNATKVSGYTISIVTTLPSVLDSNTIYFVKG